MPQPPDQELRKRREISFCTLHPDPNQARTALSLLEDHPARPRAHCLSASSIEVEYNVLDTCLEQIEQYLIDAGLHLDNRLLCRMKRALYYYSEENQRALHGCPKGQSNCTDRIFVSQYRRRDHGCRDHRPEHWRHYR